MQNKALRERVEAAHGQLMATHAGGNSLSSASRGRERQAFCENFLACVLPPAYRMSSGDITDWSGECSGEVDVAIETAMSASIPMFAGSPRLLLADGVAAVLEVKSDIAGQWTEAVATAKGVRKLKRVLGPSVSSLIERAPEIPMFALGYRGWKTMGTIEEHLMGGLFDGILVLESGLFASSRMFGSLRVEGKAESLWAFVATVHAAATDSFISFQDLRHYNR